MKHYYLIELEIYINKKGFNGEILLLKTYDSNYENILKSLVEHGTDINKNKRFDCII